MSKHSEFEKKIAYIQKLFSGDDTLRTRRVQNKASGLKFCAFFFDGMVNAQLLSLNLIMPLEDAQVDMNGDLLAIIQEKVITANEITVATGEGNIITSVQYGDCLLIVEGLDDYIIVDVKGFEGRGFSEPDLDKTLLGPKEGYNEILMQNLTLIRRRLLTNDLRIKTLELGERTKTKVCVVYLDGVANPKVVKEVYRRIDGFDLDGILDVNYLSEIIRDSPHSPFALTGSSERPDITVAKLLEGRVAILCDGSPVALTVPFMFIENFQANEDYYLNFMFGTMNRLLRILAFILTTCAPAVYLALVTFHQEMIPTPLLLSISAARAGVPFPTIVEMILMLTVFEILRETGVRMSSGIGQSFSIVGALVLGQAAVEAKIVSAPIIIVVALTGITGLMIPRLSFTSAIVRLTLVIFAYALGLYGFLFGFIFFLVHLCTLRSFGVPYMYDMTFTVDSDINDTLVRGPWWDMYMRPKFTSADRTRKGARGRGA